MCGYFQWILQQSLLSFLLIGKWAQWESWFLSIKSSMRVYKWVGVGDCFDAEGKGSGQNRNYPASCQAFRKHILWKHFAEQTQKLLRTLHCSTILHQSKPPAPLDTARTPNRVTNFLLICGNGSFSWVSKNRNSGQNKHIATSQFCTTNWFLSFRYSMVNALLIVSWLLSQGENILFLTLFISCYVSTFHSLPILRLHICVLMYLNHR